MRNQGEDFLKKIEDLKKDLEVQGSSMEKIQGDLKSEHKLIMVGNQNKRETASQRQALENIKLQIERKKLEAERKLHAPTAAPINYNAIRAKEGIKPVVSNNYINEVTKSVSPSRRNEQKSPSRLMGSHEEREIDQFAQFFMNETENLREVD